MEQSARAISILRARGATDDPRRVGMMARTRKPCSGPRCGNPRKWFGERTVQERRYAGQTDDED